MSDIDEWFAAAGEREAELPMGSQRMLGYRLMPYRPRSATVVTEAGDDDYSAS